MVRNEILRMKSFNTEKQTCIRIAINAFIFNAFLVNSQKQHY